jgi:hypothetical protein
MSVHIHHRRRFDAYPSGPEVSVVSYDPGDEDTPGDDEHGSGGGSWAHHPSPSSTTGDGEDQHFINDPSSNTAVLSYNDYEDLVMGGEDVIVDPDKIPTFVSGTVVRAEEIGIVLVVIALWVAAVVLFFNRWGKIRMLEPYVPPSYLLANVAKDDPPSSQHGQQARTSYPNTSISLVRKLLYVRF